MTREVGEAVHRAFLEILRHWDALLEESNLQQQTWAILRRVVISEQLGGFRRQLALLCGETGLYRALCSLPPRQFDVIVLRYVLRCETWEISWYLGVTRSTVDHHCRRAKERLERAMASCETQLLRGAGCGLGAGVVGLGFWWLRQQL
ncbi:RNA polymerase sigma factor [Streptomyces sp. NPDC001633]|uniref:RNA polymerase sigma factor n=1 Tax=Streptomyces sp. NPDC001633 TaxID=3364595 RepID=UPI0036AE5E15